MVRESLSRKVTFELFLIDLSIRKTQAMQGLRTWTSQAEGIVPCKGPMVESNLECSRNRTVLTTPRDGQWQFRKVKTEAMPSHLLLEALGFQN